MTNALTVSEAERRRHLEAIADDGFETFVEVGAALLALREERLYKSTHSTFENYCRERFGVSGRRCFQLMDAANVVNNIVDNLRTTVHKSGNTNGKYPPVPTSEGQVRPLVRLEPEQQRQAWQQAVAVAPNGQPTAKLVEAAARAVAAPMMQPPPVIVEEAEKPVVLQPLPGQTSFLDPEPETPTRLRPRDELEAERWALIWTKKLDDWMEFVTSLTRRGGIVELSKTWPRSRREQAKEILRDLRDVAGKCVEELEESN